MLNWSAEADEHAAHLPGGDVHVLQAGFTELTSAIDALSKLSGTLRGRSPHFLAVKCG